DLPFGRCLNGSSPSPIGRGNRCKPWDPSPTSRQITRRPTDQDEPQGERKGSYEANCRLVQGKMGATTKIFARVVDGRVRRGLQRSYCFLKSFSRISRGLTFCCPSPPPSSPLR